MKVLFLIQAVLAVRLLAWAQSVPNLVNYQGRLSDQTGAPLTPGTYGVQFRLWDTATGSNRLVWAQQQSVTIQSNGVFNVILGAPGGTQIQGLAPAVNDLTFAFSSSNRFIGVTVVTSNQVALTAPSEILPRQQILSVPFALVAGTVIPGAIGSQQLATGAVGALQLAPGAIQTANISDQSVTPEKLPIRQVGTNVPVGGLAMSESSGAWVSPSPSVLTDVPNLSVTITTRGNPVPVEFIPDASGADSNFEATSALNPSFIVEVIRDGSVSLGISRGETDLGGTGQTEATSYPPGAFRFLDVPAAGTHTYKCRMKTDSFNVYCRYIKMIAFEL